MNEEQLQLAKQKKIRNALRFFGIVTFAHGAVLTLVGLGSFFMSFSDSSGPPRLFWCAFLGLPLCFAGTVMMMFGFLGSFQRYVAGESAPVAKDVVNYMGENTQPGVKAFAKSVAEGIREGLDGGTENERRS